MKIILYFGSFDPIHLGHIIIANYVAEFVNNVDSIWFIVSHQNPLKKKNIADYESRVNMVRMAISGFNKMNLLNIESKCIPSYTINTLNKIEEKYPSSKFSLLFGKDVFFSLGKWKKYKIILNKYEIFVYPRTGKYYEIDNNIISFPKKNIIFLNGPIIEISSSFIRLSMKMGKDIRSFVNPKVWNFIKKNNIYDIMFLLYILYMQY